MDPDKYLEERVQGQIDWHDRKSQWNQRWYKRVQLVVIVVGAILPFVAGISDPEKMDLRYLVGALGVIVAISTGVMGLYRFQELWLDYRSTAEALRQEKLRYECRVDPYDADNAFPVFFDRVEALLSGQNERWQRLQSSPSTAESAGGGADVGE